MVRSIREAVLSSSDSYVQATHGNISLNRSLMKPSERWTCVTGRCEQRRPTSTKPNSVLDLVDTFASQMRSGAALGPRPGSLSERALTRLLGIALGVRALGVTVLAGKDVAAEPRGSSPTTMLRRVEHGVDIDFRHVGRRIRSQDGSRQTLLPRLGPESVCGRT